MHIDLKGLKRGQWRDLTASEMQTLEAALQGSRKDTDVTRSETRKKPAARHTERKANTKRKPSSHSRNRAPKSRKPV